MQIGATLGVGVQPGKNETDSIKKIAGAAQQFEAILLNQMLQSARQADQDDQSQDTAISDYSQQQFAQALAERGGIGIAKMVLAGLEKNAD